MHMAHLEQRDGLRLDAVHEGSDEGIEFGGQGGAFEGEGHQGPRHAAVHPGLEQLVLFLQLTEARQQTATQPLQLLCTCTCTCTCSGINKGNLSGGPAKLATKLAPPTGNTWRRALGLMTD